MRLIHFALQQKINTRAKTEIWMASFSEKLPRLVILCSILSGNHKLKLGRPPLSSSVQYQPGSFLHVCFLPGSGGYLGFGALQWSLNQISQSQPTQVLPGNPASVLRFWNASGWAGPALEPASVLPASAQKLKLTKGMGLARNTSQGSVGSEREMDVASQLHHKLWLSSDPNILQACLASYG